jgi:hypothetical protein
MYEDFNRLLQCDHDKRKPWHHKLYAALHKTCEQQITLSVLADLLLNGLNAWFHQARQKLLPMQVSQTDLQSKCHGLATAIARLDVLQMGLTSRSLPIKITYQKPQPIRPSLDNFDHHPHLV